MTKEILIKSIFFASLVLLGIAFALYYTRLAGIGNFIVVGVDTVRSINFLGSSRDALSVLITGAAVWVINGFLSMVFAKRDRFLAHLPAAVSLSVSLLILMTIGVIITTNQ